MCVFIKRINFDLPPRGLLHQRKFAAPCVVFSQRVERGNRLVAQLLALDQRPLFKNGAVFQKESREQIAAIQRGRAL